MATIGPEIDKSALIVVDMQNEVSRLSSLRKWLGRTMDWSKKRAI